MLADADLDAAVKVAVRARNQNNGQSCIAAKRFIVVREVRAAFEAAIVEAMRAYEMGDPRDPHTRLGPLQSVAARDQIHAQVEASVRDGARLLLGCAGPRGRAPAIRPPCWPTSAAGQLGARRGAVRSGRGDHRGGDQPTPSPSPTPSSSVSARACGRATTRAASARRRGVEAGMSFVIVKAARILHALRRREGSGFGRECAGFGIREFVNVKSVQVKG